MTGHKLEKTTNFGAVWFDGIGFTVHQIFEHPYYLRSKGPPKLAHLLSSYPDHWGSLPVTPKLFADLLEPPERRDIAKRDKTSIFPSSSHKVPEIHQKCQFCSSLAVVLPRLRPADAPAHHDLFPLTKSHCQVSSDFVTGKGRSATLNFPATVRFFGHWRFTGPSFETPRLLLDSSRRRRRFPTSIGH
ncbi:hypothetical protein PanWU01x14_227690 [Parasponia andersonii]|uniref:Uncharacterized protein n=1 Tax=Parasponia andersonii TaxID=3476 RepID=A0A2P5BLZ5_PARAD|nr:hypothetical protein PanWU01x14_227690 [Parasponia andersonii]